MANACPPRGLFIASFLGHGVWPTVLLAVMLFFREFVYSVGEPVSLAKGLGAVFYAFLTVFILNVIPNYIGTLLWNRYSDSRSKVFFILFETAKSGINIPMFFFLYNIIGFGSDRFMAQAYFLQLSFGTFSGIIGGSYFVSGKLINISLLNILVLTAVGAIQLFVIISCSPYPKV